MDTPIANYSRAMIERGVANAAPGVRQWQRVFTMGMAAVVLVLLVVWSYFPTLASILERWQEDPRYSHGYIVLPIALAILWSRRDRWNAAQAAPSGWGLAVLAAAALLRLIGTRCHLAWLETGSLLPTIAGLVILLTGAAGWRWAWPALAFLVFLLPLPYQLEVGMSHPLQRLATDASTYLLQTVGLPAVAEGNVIVIGDLRLGVVEACSGLGMLHTFFALSTAFALLMNRPLADKLILFASAVPIGILVNILRISATSMLQHESASEVARAWAHDMGGWLMMPLALAVLWLELCVLNRLWISTEPFNSESGALP